ncbi:MotA/TolQ/ExbB proton channel family protein [Aquimarina rhabdastrellae]
MTDLINRLIEGGPFFMFPILALFITIIVITARGLFQPNYNAKAKKFIHSIALFTVVWGIMGQVIGLIEGFDTIHFQNDASIQMLAGGIKITFLPTLFGLLTFLISRISIFILDLKSIDKQTQTN